MTFRFDDFEDQTVGSLPDGWSAEDVTTQAEVDDNTSYVIEGSKSFVLADADSGGNTTVNHPVGDEDIVFAHKWQENLIAAGNRGLRYFDVYAVDSSDTIIWRYSFHTGGDNGSDTTVEVTFHVGNPDEGQKDDATTVASYSVGTAVDVAIRDTDTSIKLFIDGTQEHDAGSGFSGAQTLGITCDDHRSVVDGGGLLLSDFVFESGSRVGLDSGSKQYVVEGEKREDVADDGGSNYTFIDGSAIARE